MRGVFLDLESLDRGTQVQIWVRRAKTDVEFIYVGLGCRTADEGSRPIKINWRLYDAIPPEQYIALGGGSEESEGR